MIKAFFVVLPNETSMIGIWLRARSESFSTGADLSILEGRWAVDWL